MRPTDAIRMFLGALLIFLAGGAYTDLARAQQSGGPGGEVGVDVDGEPRFVVKALSFQAFDETSFDFTGSDEVVFTFSTPQYYLVGTEYGNIDSNGDVHTFKPTENCITPAVDNDGVSNHVWQCRDEGVPGPLSFVIGAHEQDGGLANSVACFLIFFYYNACHWEADYNAGTDLYSPDFESVNENYPNHLIGKDDVQISLARLLEKLPQVGRSFTQNVVLVGACDLSETTSPCNDNEPLYDVTLEITRVNNVANVVVDPNP